MASSCGPQLCHFLFFLLINRALAHVVLITSVVTILGVETCQVISVLATASFFLRL